jgi:hypothetical protein
VLHPLAPYSLDKSPLPQGHRYMLKPITGLRNHVSRLSPSPGYTLYVWLAEVQGFGGKVLVYIFSSTGPPPGLPTISRPAARREPARAGDPVALKADSGRHPFLGLGLFPPVRVTNKRSFPATLGTQLRAARVPRKP